MNFITESEALVKEIEAKMEDADACVAACVCLSCRFPPSPFPMFPPLPPFFLCVEKGGVEGLWHEGSAVIDGLKT
eukprot:227295-Rhodomonas_salina.1